MKSMVILIVLFLLFTAPAFSELRPADLDKIRLIVKEEVEAAVTKSEARMSKYIETSETRMSKYVEASETRMKDQMSLEMSKLNSTIAEMDKRLNQIFMLVIALIAFIAVVIGVPQIILAMQRRNQRAQNEKIEAQQKQIEALQQQMETLTQGRIVAP